MRYKAVKTRLYLNKNEKDLLKYLMRTSKHLYNKAHIMLDNTFLILENI